jgi:type I restriction enzyme, S subunit
MKVYQSKSSWFKEGDLRLDASFHLSEGRIAKIKLKSCPYGIELLSSVCLDIFNGARFKRYYVSKRELGVPFMGNSDMLKSDFQKLKLLSRKHTYNLKPLTIDSNWILVSCSGTIGKTVYTNQEFSGKTASQHVMRIVPNNKKILGGFLYSFLTSTYGFSLLTQGTYGAVIQHIEPHHIEDLPVPIFPDEQQKKIHNLVQEASSLRVEANKTLNDVIRKIDSQFKYKKTSKSYVVNIKSIKSGNEYTNEARLESDYYNPSTNSVIKQIKESNWKYLGAVADEIHRSGLRDRTFVSKGIPLVTGQNLNLSRLTDLKQLSRRFTRNIEKNITQKNDILVTVLGTIGKIEFVFDNMYQGVFASEHMCKIKIDSKELHPGYVFAFLKSKVGNIQLLKHKTGSVIEWIKENNIGSVMIPIPEDKGQSIGEKVISLTNKRELAFKKENEAIDLVEKEIESWQK